MRLRVQDLGCRVKDKGSGLRVKVKSSECRVSLKPQTPPNIDPASQTEGSTGCGRGICIKRRRFNGCIDYRGTSLITNSLVGHEHATDVQRV